VVARKPLIIQNKALGYKITYWLESFEHNFSTRILSYSGLTYYEDLIRPNKRKAQAARWILNRESAYEGSVMHFIRSVHAGTLASSGFIVRRLDKVEGNRKGRYSNVVDPKILVEADFSDTIENQKIMIAQVEADLLLCIRAGRKLWPREQFFYVLFFFFVDELSMNKTSFFNKLLF
jgi:hypothetical protein